MFACKTEVDLSSLFRPGPEWTLQRTVNAQGARREGRAGADGQGLLLDHFAGSDVVCAFFRLRSDHLSNARVRAESAYRLKSSAAGGWLLEPEGRDFYFWIPQQAMLRRVTPNGHVLGEDVAVASRLQVTGSSSFLEFEIPSGCCFDVVVWQIPSEDRNVIGELDLFASIETQAIFLWGSHTTYCRPSDLCLHLIFGHVYENRYAWPHNRKICSENDAHALYVALSGLQRATGKNLYGFLKAQLLLSVLSRQSEDGGWHHGEWTEDMDAHLRLNGSAIHLLMDSLEERDDPVVKQALERAVGFVSRQKDETNVGSWLLHDSLELNEEGMRKSPFKWIPSRALGKSSSNMMVLNTHLDSLVLLDRYRQVTGDSRYNGLIDSAKAATRAVLALHPLDFLYRFMFRLFRLNLLPTQRQRSLPLPLRAIKRLVANWLKPNFVHLTARYPRFVMPGGYIERAIALRGMADDYHSINVMDLLRYWRRFPEENLDAIIRGAVDFIRNNNVDSHWGESTGKSYALGFWAEALYHRYLLAPDSEKLSYLAEIIIKLEECGIGFPPSLLGANAEVVPLKDQIGCPSPADQRLRVANLSRNGRAEFVVVNPTEIARELRWERIDPISLVWHNSIGKPIPHSDVIEIPQKGWVVGQGHLGTAAKISSEHEEQTIQGVISL